MSATTCLGEQEGCCSPKPLDASRVGILPSRDFHRGRAVDPTTKDRLLTGIFLTYVVLLAIATVGELFEIATIQRCFDVKRLFTG